MQCGRVYACNQPCNIVSLTRLNPKAPFRPCFNGGLPALQWAMPPGMQYESE